MKIFSSKHEKELNKALKTILAPQMNSLGYKYEGVSDVSSSVIPYCYEGVFSNISANRALNIRYSPAGPKTKEVLICRVSLITYELDKFDYTSTNQMSVPCTDISIIDKELGEKFAHILTQIRESLVEDFEQVLNGNMFETEHFDWQGLK